MSAGGAAPTPKPKSGLRSALEYTGIPPSWFEKRPKLPSRNWLIFLSVTGSLAAAYVYDRRECKRIRQRYVDRVKHLADAPLASMDLPRKVTVYAAKWPGDEEWDRASKYFRKYVKPILVAAAVDYEIIPGKSHGDISKHIASAVLSQRRIAAGLDPPKQNTIPLVNRDPEQVRQRELEGGTVLIGRATFKEYMHGLKKGWTNGLEKVDPEDILAQELADDGKFDEPEEAPREDAGIVGEGGDEPAPTPSRLAPAGHGSPLFSPLKMPGVPQSSPSTLRTHTSPHPDFSAPPLSIPPQPPLLLVPFTNLVGLKLIPLMLWDFFNERHKVRAGSEAGLRLVHAHTRPFLAPPPSLDSDPLISSPPSPESPMTTSPDPSAPSQHDLGFDVASESYYKTSLRDFPSNIDKTREKYYKDLPERLATARALARGEREPTKEEVNTPPPSEVELRAERLKREARWRGDVDGWEVIRSDRDAEWDERFRGVLRVFDDVPDVELESP